MLTKKEYAQAVMCRYIFTIPGFHPGSYEEIVNRLTDDEINKYSIENTIFGAAAKFLGLIKDPKVCAEVESYGNIVVWYVDECNNETGFPINCKWLKFKEIIDLLPESVDTEEE